MFQLPGSVTICGKTYTVETDPELGFAGGCGDTESQKIILGQMDNPERKQEVFLHEVMEVAMLERDMCYRDFRDVDNNDGRIFVFNHGQFEQYVKDIAQALKPWMILDLPAQSDSKPKRKRK